MALRSFEIHSASLSATSRTAQAKCFAAGASDTGVDQRVEQLTLFHVEASHDGHAGNGVIHCFGAAGDGPGDLALKLRFGAGGDGDAVVTGRRRGSYSSARLLRLRGLPRHRASASGARQRNHDFVAVVGDSDGFSKPVVVDVAGEPGAQLLDRRWRWFGLATASAASTATSCPVQGPWSATSASTFSLWSFWHVTVLS